MKQIMHTFNYFVRYWKENIVHEELIEINAISEKFADSALEKSLSKHTDKYEFCCYG